eukprot:16434594-Heterocapsa_arctica.AAC.1
MDDDKRGKDIMGDNCAIRPSRTQRERAKRTLPDSAQAARELEELYACDWTVDAAAMKAMKAKKEYKSDAVDKLSTKIDSMTAESAKLKEDI